MLIKRGFDELDCKEKDDSSRADVKHTEEVRIEWKVRLFLGRTSVMPKRINSDK